MTDKLRLTDVIAPFTGDGDAAEWWARFEAVANLKGYSNEEKVQCVPLLLRGPPFLVYNELSDAKKKKLLKVKDSLLTAFSISKFAAFEQLRLRNCRTGENVDAYFAAIKRLCGLAGVAGPHVPFVIGMPPEIGSVLRTMTKSSDTEIVARARVLVESTGKQDVVAITQQSWSGGVNFKDRFKEQRTCYVCQQAGHISRDCNMRTRFGNRQSSVVTCRRCGKEGHTSPKCRTVMGNEEGVAVTQANSSAAPAGQ